MRYVFDTCTLVWFANGQTELISEAALNIINTAGNEGIVSVASFLELAMKASAGKIAFPAGAPFKLARLCQEQGLLVAPLTVDDIHHFLLLSALHNNPFDRLIASMSNGAYGPCPILSPDTSFDTYSSSGVMRIW